jgi:type VI secretion system protein ImpC
MTNPRPPKISFGSASAAEEDFVPLRLVVIADLAPQNSPLVAAHPRLLSIDKDSFTEILHTLCPNVELHIQDPQTPQPSFTTIQLAPEDLKSFHPAALVRQVDSLRKLLEGRQALLDLRDRKLSRDQFLEKMKSAPLPFFSPAAFSAPPSAQRSPARKPSDPTIPSSLTAVPPAASGGNLDAILSMVETPAEPAPPSTLGGGARVQQFIDSMMDSRGAQPAVDRATVDSLLVEADRVLSDRMNDILAHPEFSRLETAWRSLKFLVDRTDFRSPIRLQVVAARKEDLLKVLNFLIEEAEVAETPVAAVITDFEFDSSAPDMDLLRQAAQLAEQLMAPLVANVGAKFFGKPSPSDVAAIPVLSSHMESAPFVKWTGLRESGISRWLGVTFNRFLLRGRFDESSSGKLPFDFHDRGDGVWGNASWAVASLLVRSFASSQWCGHITGIQGGGLVDDLPLHSWRFPSGEETRAPLQTLFLHGREADFADEGFLVFQSGQDQDMAVLLRAPTAHKPERYPDPRDTEAARLRATLAYQLVAGRFAHYLGMLLRKHSSLASASELQNAIVQGLRAHLGKGGAGGNVDVALQDSEHRAGFWDVAISISPGPSIWPLPIKIDLVLPHRKF